MGNKPLLLMYCLQSSGTLGAFTESPVPSSAKPHWPLLPKAEDQISYFCLNNSSNEYSSPGDDGQAFDRTKHRKYQELCLQLPGANLMFLLSLRKAAEEGNKKEMQIWGFHLERGGIRNGCRTDKARTQRQCSFKNWWHKSLSCACLQAS